MQHDLRDAHNTEMKCYSTTQFDMVQSNVDEIEIRIQFTLRYTPTLTLRITKG